MQEMFYEWVVRVGNKDFYLTDKQHAVLLKAKNKNIRIVAFEEFTLNTSFFEYSYRREARELRKKFLCPECSGMGAKIDFKNKAVVGTTACSNCNGTGMRIK